MKQSWWSFLKSQLPATKQDFRELEKKIMTQAEALQSIKDAQAKAEKIATETRGLVDKVNQLLEQMGTVSPDLEASIGELWAQLDVVDSLVPDAPPV